MLKLIHLHLLMLALWLADTDADALWLADTDALVDWLADADADAEAD